MADTYTKQVHTIDEVIQSKINVFKKGIDCAKGLEVGKPFVSAYAGAEANGISKSSPDHDYFVQGFLSASKYAYTTDDNNIITAISKH